MGRVLGIDYGTVRVGIAMSDPMRIISSPHATIPYKSDKALVKDILDLMKEYDADEIVLGHPMGLSGNKTKKTEEVEKFCEMLRSTGVIVHLVDESFTSEEAKKIMHKMKKKSGHNKEMVDMIAASLILKDYLNSIKF
ncbi:MAG: Holliday junction resolvase RuvX [Candidatus Cloacimonadota bacterium]|nr:MAG: Holliday junction resolvase RuvX [Candidatus Cloacimonadota bacterium]PIE77742.1 MAG: Holliday junction resolvase RuvX [Candidatus Delongbacteria bacterium]